VLKTRRYLELPLNETAYEILASRHAVKHGPYVFYNAGTGDRFNDVKNGLQTAVTRAGLSGITWHTFRHYAEFRTMPSKLSAPCVFGFFRRQDSA
jgi:integrase